VWHISRAVGPRFIDLRWGIVLSDAIGKLRMTIDQSCVILIFDSTDIVGADPFGTGSA